MESIDEQEMVMTAVSREMEHELGLFGSNNANIELPQQLVLALEQARVCTSFIEPEQNRIRQLLTGAKSEKEVEAREFQIEYIENYLTRAASIATRRLDYFKTLNTNRSIEAELEKIKMDKIHWFDQYAWGHDPRARSTIAVVPFELFSPPKQFSHRTRRRSLQLTNIFNHPESA